MKKLVMTMAAGRYQEIVDLIYPRFKAYAKKCDAEFISIEDCKYPNCPVVDKLRLIDYFQDFDRILFIDADILIRADAPSLFDLVHPDKVAAYDEGSTLWHLQDLISRISDVNKLAELWRLPKADWPSVVRKDEILPYYNSGVVLLGKQHQCLWESPPAPLKNPTGVVPCAEQCYFNWAIRQHKPAMHHLPVCFNQMPYNRAADYKESSYFIHYAGFEKFDERAAEMRRDAEVWANGLEG
jgi:lipopolysaccharide biosynthesis glycosyltransferase